MPKYGGVQVLPVQWRHKIEFGQKKKDVKKNQNEGVDIMSSNALPPQPDAVKRIIDSTPDLDDITLDGVPSIRMLVSDLVIDGNFWLHSF
jgi:hypothetical protein